MAAKQVIYDSVLAVAFRVMLRDDWAFSVQFLAQFIKSEVANLTAQMTEVVIFTDDLLSKVTFSFNFWSL